MIKGIFSLIAFIFIAIAGIYYIYFPKFIEQQVVNIAREKGIQELDLKAPYISLNKFGVKSLSGHHEGRSFGTKNLEVLWSPSVILDFIKLQYDNTSGEEIERIGYKLPTFPLKQASFDLLEYTTPKYGTLSLSGTAKLNSTLENPELIYDGNISLPNIELNQCSLSVKPTNIIQKMHQILNSSPDLDFTLSVKKLIANIPNKDTIEATLDGQGTTNKSQVKGSLNILLPRTKTNYKIDGRYNTTKNSGVINYKTEGKDLLEIDKFIEKLKVILPKRLVIKKR